MTKRWVGAAAIAVVVVSGCSSSSGDDKPKESGSPEASATASAAASSEGGLRAEWEPRLKKLDGSAATKACQDAGSTDCATRLAEIQEVAAELGTATDTAGGVDAYPLTIKQLADMAESYSVYRAEGCAGAVPAPSSCMREALSVTVGVSSLQVSLMGDEAGK